MSVPEKGFRPPSLRAGFVLGIVAVVMTSAAPLLMVLGPQLSPDQVPLASMVGTQVTWLGMLPLLLAIMAFTRRPARPAVLLPIALALSTAQSVGYLLAMLEFLPLDYTTLFALIIATGSSFGVLAIALLPDDRRGRPLVRRLLIGVGVSIAGAILFSSFTVLAALAITIMLGIELRSRRERAAATSEATPVDPAAPWPPSGAAPEPRP